ncbi:enolase C-terminal domain-like protein [Halobellus ruber]|uniref:enolase C-terminal domain-like protein n=1 Tax=Halobellus ruber TaxID=2761102 RepID=UPI0031B56726
MSPRLCGSRATSCSPSPRGGCCSNWRPTKGWSTGAARSWRARSRGSITPCGNQGPTVRRPDPRTARRSRPRPVTGLPAARQRLPRGRPRRRPTGLRQGLPRVQAQLRTGVSGAGARGISELRKIASLAESFDAAVVPYCPLGPVAFAASLQVGFCSGNVVMQERDLELHDPVSSERLALLGDPHTFEFGGGHVERPDPGWGSSAKSELEFTILVLFSY